MRMLDAELRRDPRKEEVWERAFQKARQGWRRYNFALDYLAAPPVREDHFRTILMEADQKFTEALQILASAGLHRGELGALIRKSMIQVGELYSFLREPAEVRR